MRTPRPSALARVLGIAVAALLALIIFLTSVQLVAFNLGFYRSEYRKYDRPAAIGMSEDDLMRTTQALLEYVTGRRPDLKVEATVGGVRRKVFDQRELEHMVDVRALFVKGFALRRQMIFAALGLLVVLVLVARRRTLSSLAGGFIGVGLATLAVIVVLVIMFNLNFTWFWDGLHYIFFSNNLWQLDPSSEIMINMFPEEFFYDTAIRVVGIFVGAMAVLGGAGWLYLRSLRARD